MIVKIIQIYFTHLPLNVMYYKQEIDIILYDLKGEEIHLAQGFFKFLFQVYSDLADHPQQLR